MTDDKKELMQRDKNKNNFACGGQGKWKCNKEEVPLEACVMAYYLKKINQTRRQTDYTPTSLLRRIVLVVVVVERACHWYKCTSTMIYEDTFNIT